MSESLFSNDFIIEYIREQRDNLLTITDKYMLPDFPITDGKKEEWKIYRQELRDITKKEMDNITMDDTFQIEGITWPTQPS
jgi:hypothetical protein